MVGGPALGCRRRRGRAARRGGGRGPARRAHPPSQQRRVDGLVPGHPASRTRAGDDPHHHAGRAPRTRGRSHRPSGGHHVRAPTRRHRPRSHRGGDRRGRRDHGTHRRARQQRRLVEDRAGGRDVDRDLAALPRRRPDRHVRLHAPRAATDDRRRRRLDREHLLHRRLGDVHRSRRRLLGRQGRCVGAHQRDRGRERSPRRAGQCRRPVDDSPLWWTVDRLVGAYADRELSPVEVVELAEAHIEATDSLLHAYVAPRPSTRGIRRPRRAARVVVRSRPLRAAPARWRLAPTAVVRSASPPPSAGSWA